MTQIFKEDGSVVPVTVIEAGPLVVVQKKTVEKDKYNDMKDKVESQQKLIEALLRAQNIEPDKFIV